MEIEVKEKGVNLTFKIHELNPSKQVTQIEELINQGIDVLIVVPSTLPSLSNVIEKAHNAGIKILSHHTRMKNTDVDLFTSFNNTRVGQLHGKYLVEKVPNGNYILLEGPGSGEFVKAGAMVAVTGKDAELDAVRRIIEGTQLMTVFKDARKLGKDTIDNAIKLDKGEPIKKDTKLFKGKMNVPTIYVEPIALDKNNIGSVLINSGYLKKEDVYKRNRA